MDHEVEDGTKTPTNAWRFPETGVPDRQARADVADAKAQNEYDPFGDAWYSSIAQAGVRKIQDETGPLITSILGEGIKPTPSVTAVAVVGALVGFVGGEDDYDKDALYDELTTGIPSNLHEDIMQHGNRAAAFRARQRILDSMSVDQRIAAQGATTNPLMFIDPIEIPLIAMTGGGYAAAKAASLGAKVAVRAGLSTGSARVLANTFKGVAAGVSEGALLGAGGMAWSESYGWTELAFNIAGGAVFGGALGSAGIVSADTARVRQAFDDVHKDLERRVIDQDPSLTATVGDDLVSPTIVTPDMHKQAGAGSVGAQFLGTAPVHPKRADLNEDPAGNVSESTRTWAEATEEWKVESGWEDRKIDDIANDPLLKATEGLEDSRLWSAAGEAGHKVSGNSFAHNVWKSNASVMNWFGGEIFESANGLGRGRMTAAVLKEVYEQRASSPMRRIAALRGEWAKASGNTFLNVGYGTSVKGRLSFDRSIRLELNARQHGHAGTSDKHISAAADAQGAISTSKWDIAQGRDGEHAIDGFEGTKRDATHQNYTWSGRNMRDVMTSGKLAKTLVESRRIMITAMTAGYRAAGMAAHKDASIVAQAVVARSLRTGEGVDTSVLGLLSKDGQAFMEETLKMNRVDEATRKGIMDRLVGTRAEAKQEGFTKGRNDIDLSTVIPTIDGSDVKLVDLLMSDLTRDNHTQIRKVSGAAALARKGITNRAMREEVIEAAGAQQRSLGETAMDANELRAMFTHFDGGGIKGWTKGGDPALAEQTSVMVRRAANVAFLGKLGLTQLGETGAIIASIGVKNFVERGMLPWIKKASKEGREALLKDVGFVYGEIGYDHIIRGGHFNLDDVGDGSIGDKFMQSLDTKISDATYINGAVSGFNFTRGEQHKISVSGIIDKIFQNIRNTNKAIDPAFIKRAWVDLGIDERTLSDLQEEIINGNVVFHKDGFVMAINSQEWSGDLQDMFAVALHRNTAQVVQKSMAGEQDAWMSTTFLGLLAHLKTFPLAAVNKQARRHSRSGDTEAYSAVAWGLATATAAVMIRNVVNGREQDVEQIARSAVQYSNMTGWAVMGTDTIATILGLDDMKVNPYAGGDLTPPSLAWLGNAMKVPGAIGDVIDGDDKVSGKSRAALRAIPFASTVGFSNAISATK